jgi:hypothetical protein
LLSPSAAANTIRDRIASEFAVLRRLVHASSNSRSSPLSAISTAAGLGITESYYCTETNDSRH